MKIFKDIPLSSILYYKIGGKAKFLIEVESKEDVVSVIDFIHKEKINKILIAGLGANLLVSDEYFDGAVIRFVKGKSSQILLRQDGLTQAFAGESISDVIKFMFDNKLMGLEWASGIPSTVGAGVRGNIGAFGFEIKDVFVEAEILKINDIGLEIIRMTKDELNFIYRGSEIKNNKNMVVISAVFNLEKADDETFENAKNTYTSNLAYRKAQGSYNYPSCGSVFKNINEEKNINKILSVWPDVKEKIDKQWHGKISVGYVIERLGFSGCQVGDAKVSENHANFITNLGNAKFLDVMKIIEDIQIKFEEMFGFIPQLEVEVVK